MKLLSVRDLADTGNYSSDDSDVETTSLPVNLNFRCSKKKRSDEQPNDDFFSLDTAGDEELMDESAPEEISKSSETLNTRPGAKSNSKADTDVSKVLEKAFVRPGFETSLGSKADLESKNAIKKRLKAEREKTTGKSWFNLPATELTEEAKADLELIRMRGALDPLRHYRKNDRKVLPKYFQVGKVVDDPREFYSGRLTKKERKRTILDEAMSDTAAVEKSKKKYKEITTAERMTVRGTFQKSKTRSKIAKDSKAKKKNPNKRK